MPIVTPKQMLMDAKTGGYAVSAFNVENMEMMQAVIDAAEELSAPILLQSTPSTIKYVGIKLYSAMAFALASERKVQIALHLDHGNSVDLCKSAIQNGYSSIMIDGSHASFIDNIAITKQVVEMARDKNIHVEAELGKVGGKEDDLEANGDSNTNPEEALEFIDKTSVDSLAIAIGTAHGFYNGNPVLDKDRLSAISKLVNIPLVLHGASGLSAKDVKDCISRGICKVNFATELRDAYSKGVKAVLNEKPDTFDPKVYGKAGYEEVKKLAIEKIILCGSDGKAK